MFGFTGSWLSRGGRTVRAELRSFFGCDLHELPVVSRSFSTVELPNLQLAVDHFVDAPGTRSWVIGYTSAMGAFQNDLRSLIADNPHVGEAQTSAAQYREVDIDVDSQMQCVENGIHLINAPCGRVAAHVRSDMMKRGLELEVMASSTELATQFLEHVRVRISEANVFRGKIVSLECAADVPGRDGFGQIRFHKFPNVSRDEIILPPETLEMLERNTVRFFQHADALRRSGRSLKRGLLLHGKPGTGKTFTAKWLAQELRGVTTILISGDQLGLVKECCQLARLLAPSLVILEDVDLIAGERDEQRHPAYQVTLHQLMNEMDGLASNTEILFLLTTNRPEQIERAISARPGRVDQAIEFPAPDADCRSRLFELYGRGLILDLHDSEQLIAKTDGASPAFIQELLRKAALVAAERGDIPGGTIRLTDSDLDLALREMIYGGGELTRNILGFAPG